MFLFLCCSKSMLSEDWSHVMSNLSNFTTIFLEPFPVLSWPERNHQDADI